MRKTGSPVKAEWFLLKSFNHTSCSGILAFTYHFLPLDFVTFSPTRDIASLLLGPLLQPYIAAKRPTTLLRFV